MITIPNTPIPTFMVQDAGSPSALTYISRKSLNNIESCKEVVFRPLSLENRNSVRNRMTILQEKRVALMMHSSRDNRLVFVISNLVKERLPENRKGIKFTALADGKKYRMRGKRIKFRYKTAQSFKALYKSFINQIIPKIIGNAHLGVFPELQFRVFTVMEGKAKRALVYFSRKSFIDNNQSLVIKIVEPGNTDSIRHNISIKYERRLGYIEHSKGEPLTIALHHAKFTHLSRHWLIKTGQKEIKGPSSCSFRSLQKDAYRAVVQCYNAIINNKLMRMVLGDFLGGWEIKKIPGTTLRTLSSQTHASHFYFLYITDESYQTNRFTFRPINTINTEAVGNHARISERCQLIVLKSRPNSKYVLGVHSQALGEWEFDSLKTPILEFSTGVRQKKLKDMYGILGGFEVIKEEDYAYLCELYGEFVEETSQWQSRASPM